jgi:predicted transcriptional regulator
MLKYLPSNTKYSLGVNMEDYLKQAVEIVKAQASVRNMNEEEITSMIKALAGSIRGVAEGAVPAVETEPAIDPKKAIKERSVICCECGKSFKVLTKRHLAAHGLTPEQYKEKFGYKKGTSLVAKSLARDRRKTMQDMKLWEKRKKASKAE